MVSVIKRNGDLVDFDSKKIYNALFKAYKEIYPNGNSPEYIFDIIAYIKEILEDLVDPIEVEDIQDIIEDQLMEYDKLVAKVYVKYRYKRGVMRNCSTEFIRSISEKINATDVQNSNANMDENSFSGRVGAASDEMMKQYALDFCMSKMAKDNHLNNEIYIHDLNQYAIGSHNCLSIPFDKLLKEGFNTRQVDIRPANSINTAFQLVAVIFQLQSLCQFGGVSATHLDWTMIPYVRKSFWKHFKDGLKWFDEGNESHYFTKVDISKMPIEPYYHTSVDEQCIPLVETAKITKAYSYAMEMTKRELEQSVEGLYHNLNSLQSRSGAQLPFTSINYGSCTLPEGRMVIEALLQGSIKGVGKFHKTSVFPCGIFQLGNGINKKPGDPNYDLYRLALRSTAQRLYPNYANLDWSGNNGYDKNDPKTFFSTMGL